MKLRENFLELCILTRIRRYYEKRDTVTDYQKCSRLQKLIDIYQFEVSGSLKEEVI
jgi:hypothetical protein